MEIKDRDVLKLDNGKNYQIQGIKDIDGRKVYCVQDLEEGYFKFAIEKDSKLVFVKDKQAEEELVEVFNK